MDFAGYEVTCLKIGTIDPRLSFFIHIIIYFHLFYMTSDFLHIIPIGIGPS